MPKIIPRKAIVSALRRTKGNIAAAAETIGCSRMTLWRRCQAEPKLQRIVDECRETVLDYVESALDKAAVAGDPWAVMFKMRTIGRKRGYVEKDPELPALEMVLAQLPSAIAEAIRRELAQPVPTK